MIYIIPGLIILAGLILHFSSYAKPKASIDIDVEVEWNHVFLELDTSDLVLGTDANDSNGFEYLGEL